MRAKETHQIFPFMEELSHGSLKIPEYEKGNEYLIAEQWHKRLSMLQGFFADLQTRDDWQLFIKTFITNKEVLCDGLFSLSDPRSEIYTVVSAYLSHPEIRTAFLTAIDEVSKLERNQIWDIAKNNNNTVHDVDILLVGGSGLHGTISSVEIQANDPSLNILSIDGYDVPQKLDNGLRSKTYDKWITTADTFAYL